MPFKKYQAPLFAALAFAIALGWVTDRVNNFMQEEQQLKNQAQLSTVANDARRINEFYQANAAFTRNKTSVLLGEFIYLYRHRHLFRECPDLWLGNTRAKEEQLIQLGSDLLESLGVTTIQEFQQAYQDCNAGELYKINSENGKLPMPLQEFANECLRF